MQNNNHSPKTQKNDSTEAKVKAQKELIEKLKAE